MGGAGGSVLNSASRNAGRGTTGRVPPRAPRPDPVSQVRRGTDMRPPTRLPYLPALDGLRALAVVAVLLYHLQIEHAVGGYLGVEVFFVVSGYLITGLLLGERERAGYVNLRSFWERRARRLLPAVFVLVPAVCVLGLILAPGDVAAFRGDAAASLLYVQNWWLIISDQSYFGGLGRPSPLRHLWSLAIEEQFYLIWPIVVGVIVHRRSRRWLLGFTLVGIAVSASLMWAMVDVVAPDRVYYGTDTRAFGVLAGAALAIVWRPGAVADRGVRLHLPALDFAAAVALVALLWQFEHRSEFDSFTFPWGLIWVDVLTLVLIACAATAGSRVASGLGIAPLVAVGKRSYSLYLWHWPVFVFLRPGEDMSLTGWPAIVVRLGLTVVLAELSYRYIEQPFRDRRAQGWIRSQSAQLRERGRLRVSLAGLGTLVVLLGAAVVNQQPAKATALEEQLLEAATELDDIAEPDATPSSTLARAGTTTTSVAPPTAPPPDDASTAETVTIVGESVTVGASAELRKRFPTATINAEIGRSFADGVAIVETLAAQGQLQPTVVLHIGHNGAVPKGALDRIYAAVAGRRLVLVTVNVPRRWESQVNSSLRSFAEAHEGVLILDWKAIAQQEPGLLLEDRVHMTPAGNRRYADLLFAAIGPA